MLLRIVLIKSRQLVSFCSASLWFGKLALRIGSNLFHAGGYVWVPGVRFEGGHGNALAKAIRHMAEDLGGIAYFYVQLCHCGRYLIWTLLHGSSIYGGTELEAF